VSIAVQWTLCISKLQRLSNRANLPYIIIVVVVVVVVVAAVDVALTCQSTETHASLNQIAPH